MISHKHKYIFVHIPKTGGSSIEKALLRAEGVDTSEIAFGPGSHGINCLSEETKEKFFLSKNLNESPQHWPLKEYPREFQEDYFCFAFVRNPWALWVSEFRALRPERLGLDPDITFEEFVDRPVRFDYHLAPQFKFINHNINYVGRFESLDEEFEKVCNLIGVDAKLEHNNESKKYKGKHWVSFYTDELRTKVMNKPGLTGWLDAQIFNYGFHGMLINSPTKRAVDKIKKKVAIVQLADEKYYETFRACTHTVSTYCEKQGYDHIASLPVSEDCHLTYQKPRLILDHFDDYDYIMWMDVDAAIVNDDIRVEDVAASNQRDIYYCEDPGSDKGGYALNAGVLMFQTTEYSKAILEEWWESRVRGTDGPWRTGDGEDQSRLITILKNREKKFDPLPGRVMNAHPKAFRSGDFILHFMGYGTEDIDEHLRHCLKYYGSQGTPQYREHNFSQYLEAWGKIIPDALTRVKTNDHDKIFAEEVEQEAELYAIWSFTQRQRDWYSEAANEVGKKASFTTKDDFYNPANKQYEDYTIFPKRYWTKACGFSQQKTLDFHFAGAFYFSGSTKYSQVVGWRNRKWVIDFARRHFTENSYFLNTTGDRGLDKVGEKWEHLGSFDKTFQEVSPLSKGSKGNIDFDVDYYRAMCKSKFVLCPAGDGFWSMRFLEAIMCKAIPIISKSEEAWRSKAESKLDYKYYLSTEKPEYREDWIEHNYKIFLDYHTFS